MTGEIRSELRERLAALDRAGLSRELRLARDDRVDFASNDYLGLSRHPLVVEAAREAAQQFGAGARASRLLGGGSDCDREAELALTSWLDAEDALLFASGFQANLGLLATLVSPGDALISDARNHASLIDAARLTKARRLVYAHEDMADLEARLEQSRGARRRWVVTEGVFSMDGDLASLVEIAALCARHDAWLIVDEAHSLGVLGAEGAGAWAAACAAGADESRLAARVAPCGKGLGAQGGFVVGCKELRDLLLATARSFVFSTGVAPATSGAIAAAIPLARTADRERAHLRELAEVFGGVLEQEPSPSAIVPIVVGDNELALSLARQVQAAGFEVRAVRPPTVPVGTARLRIVLHAHNTLEQAGQLARQLRSHRVSASAAPAPRDQALVVVGTDTDIGKTIVSALLVRAAARRGPVSYWKPVQTGDDSDTETVRNLAAGSSASFEDPSYAFPLPASPHEAAADAGRRVEVSELEARFSELKHSVKGALVIELAGGLLVPYDEHETQADLLARLRPRLVLVARSGLGTLNHTLLTLEALRARRLEPEALILVGDEHPSNRETLRSVGNMPLVYEVPRFATLTPAVLDEWLDDNDLGPLFHA